MSIRAQEGNVTLITAFTAALLLIVILLATGIGQNAAGSTRMQSSSDGAALTAASGYIMALNDNTLLDTLQWTVNAVSNLGEALQIAGEAIIAAATAAEAASLGLASAAAAVLIVFGGELISAGSALTGVGDAMKGVVTPFVTAAKKVVDVAKFVLAIANSSIIASNNGYLGFMLPTALTAAGALKYDKTDADKIVRHSKEITSDTSTPDSDGQGFFLRASLKETLRRAALRDLWSGGKQGQGRGHNTFQVWNSATPGCNSTWDTVGADPTPVQIDSNGVLGQATPIPRDCSSEFKYLVQLLNRSFNAQLAELKSLRAKMNLPNAFDDSQGSLADANKEIDDQITALQGIVSAPQGPSNVSISATGPQSDVFPNVPSGLSNQAWANYVYSYYHSKDRGLACKGASAQQYSAAKVPFAPFGDGSDANNQTFFGCLTTESQTNPVNPATVPGPHSFAYTSTQNNQSTTVYYWWTSPTQTRDVQASDVGSPPGPAGTPCCFDFRTTEDYVKSRRFVGDAEGLLKYIEEVLRYGHTTKGADATKPITFLEFQKQEPTYMAATTARLSAQPQPKAQYALGSTIVDVKLTADDNDRISFKQFCSKLFGGRADDNSLLGFLPANGASWCAALADLFIGAASAISDAPEPIKSILGSIFGDPPPTQVYHAELHVPASTDGICQALNVVKEIEQGTSSFDAVWKEVTNPPTSVATSC